MKDDKEMKLRVLDYIITLLEDEMDVQRDNLIYAQWKQEDEVRYAKDILSKHLSLLRKKRKEL